MQATTNIYSQIRKFLGCRIVCWVEAKAPVDCTLDNLKELAKDIFSKQVEPLSYATIYKYIADHYGYKTWKDFKKILESK